MLTRQTLSSSQQHQELFVYDVPTGTISLCSFGDEGSVPRSPQQHFWDAEHPLLLACELAGTGAAQKKKGATAIDSELEVATLFATPQGIVLQECQNVQTCQVILLRHSDTLVTTLALNSTYEMSHAMCLHLRAALMALGCVKLHLIP